MTGERRRERAKETAVGEGQVGKRGRVLELGGRWVERARALGDGRVDI